MQRQLQKLRGLPALQKVKQASVEGQRDERKLMAATRNVIKQAQKEHGIVEVLPRVLLNDYVAINPACYNNPKCKDIIARCIQTENGYYTGKVIETSMSEQTAKLFGQNVVDDKEEPIPQSFLQLVDPHDNAPSETVFFKTEKSFEKEWKLRNDELKAWNDANPDAQKPQLPPMRYYDHRTRHVKRSLKAIPYEFDNRGVQAQLPMGYYDTDYHVAETRSFVLDDPFAMPFPKELRY